MDATEEKPVTNVAEETGATEPKLAQTETEMATHPVGSGAEANEEPTVTEKATDAVSGAAATTATAASGVKDNVFSMFGGGTKEKKKETEDDPEEESGSSKKKVTEGGEEVWIILSVLSNPY